MLKRTPLNAAHRAAGAKMVDFGGWEMPLHYGSQLDEHLAVRSDCGMFDVSHMQAVDFKGEDARAFLRYLLANNVDKLQQPGRALYSCLLNPAGGVIDDLIVYSLDENFFRIVVNAGTADKDIAWFMQMRDQRAPTVAITPRRDLAILAVQGPNARSRVWQALPGSEAVSSELKPFWAAQFEDGMIGRTGYTGEDGFEIVAPAARIVGLWSALLERGVKPCGLGARDTLRLEAGMNLYGQDMDETISPLESGLAWTVDLESARDFVGKTALAAQRPARQSVGLLVVDKGGVSRAHQKVYTPQGVGEITSGTFSPTLRAAIAFARVPTGAHIGDQVEIEIRDKRLAARVVKLPFVRQGKVLV
jgi:aminomethyltransferase